MKIIVCIKQAPSRDSALRLNQEGKWLDESDISWEMNEPDAYALEEALQLKEKLGGEVIAVSAGPERVLQTIREALAKGADRAIHVQTQEGETGDALSFATLLAEALRTEKPDLILTGLQSDDLGYGQTGVILAELLGLAHATIVMEVTVEGSAVRVKRELEDGWFQYVTLPQPALLTIQSGIRKLRYATLMGIKKAKTKEIRKVDPGNAAPGVTVDRMQVPVRAKQGQLFSGDARQAAAELVQKLKSEARVL